MIKFVKSLGSMSEEVPAQILPGIKNPKILIFCRKNSICLWNPKNKSVLAILEETNSLPDTIVLLKVTRIWSSSEILILTGMLSGKISLWKINLSRISIRFSFYIGHFKRISCFQISNKGKIILSGCVNGGLVSWNITDHRGIFRNKNAHLGQIKSLEFFKDIQNRESKVISFGIDNLVKVWDLKTGICIKNIELGNENFSEIFIQKKRNVLLALNNNGKVSVFNIIEPFSLNYSGKFQGKKICYKAKLLFDTNQSVLFLNDGTRTIDVFLPKKGKIMSKICLEKKPIENLENYYFNIISFHFKNNTKGLTIWRKKERGNWIILLHDLETNVLDFFHLFFKKNLNQKVEISIKRVLKRKIDSHLGEIRSILWFMKDRFLISLCNSVQKLYIWNISLQKCVKKLRLFSSYVSMEFFDDNTIVMGSSTGKIDLYEISSGKLIFSENNAHQGPIWTLDCAENSYYLGTGSSDGILKIWEMELQQIILAKKLSIKEQILNIKLLKDKDMIILSGISSVIWAFSLTLMEFKFSLLGHSLPIISFSLCDNKKLLATASVDLSVRIWDIFEKNQKKILFPDDSVVSSVVFQPSSINFLSASRKGNIKFWNGKNFSEFYQLEGYHNGPIWTIKFSESGNYFASASSDKNLIIWKINDLKIINGNFKTKETGSAISKKLVSENKDGNNTNKIKKIAKKFHSILKFLCQIKKQNYPFTLKVYLKNLFLKLDKQHLLKVFKQIKNSEIIIFLSILADKSENFRDWNFISNFSKIIKLLVILKGKQKNLGKKNYILLIKKNIEHILEFEKKRAIQIINGLKKMSKTDV